MVCTSLATEMFMAIDIGFLSTGSSRMQSPFAYYPELGHKQTLLDVILLELDRVRFKVGS